MVRSHIIPFLRTFCSSSTSSWNSRIAQAVSHGDAANALVIFRHLKQQSYAKPNNFTFPVIAKACGKLSDLQASRMIHADVVKTPYSSDIYVQTALVDAYAKCTNLDCALRLFDEMSHRDVASWNAIVVGYAQIGDFDCVSVLIKRMRSDGIMPDAVTIMGLTQLASGINHGSLLSCVHCLGMKYGLGGDVSVANTWISCYGKCGDLCSAEMVFSCISRDALCVVSWNAMIAGCACFEDSEKAIGVYQSMINGGYRPDVVTFVNLLSAIGEPKYLHYGMRIHALAVKEGSNLNATLLNTLISMYTKCGDLNSARSIFGGMNERSHCSWTVMIGGYSGNGDLGEAFSLLDEMEASGKKPDTFTVIYLIAGCGKVGTLESGKLIDNYTMSKGLKNNVMVCNALLDMYMKCGSEGDAQKLFLAMNEKNVVSWTTMISGFALNGNFQEALDHFNEMLEVGIKPNHITFLAVLQACTHGGLLEKGWEVFDMMKRTYGINPGLDHYACMTDLLGRRGKLKEALDFIQEMPMKPDAGIWGSLLGACKIHGSVDIGEQAAYKLFQLQPQAAAPYVEMANIYASQKDWSGVAAMRVNMKSKQVTKSPGQSIVFVDGVCCSFTVEDRSHPKGFQTFETLDSLVLQLKNETDLIAVEELVL
ncbi:pentatricopeptide repeat-containing protein At4g19191, mitochondrial [Andrographis paniculata]|uniref:pentatricopeptide repeat-containing protein At4g19191, mitochondrial n=1 Tax=Andrographis paniculata TaxID=175694 RepID=UPI0021E8C53D|nr:pentatricopeptide repeat-containing protein At4g19191, mitochondrial [Andrographis paniculata]